MEEEENPDVEDQFYTDAVKYWDGIPSTVDGMLGGFGFMSPMDIAGSVKFLENLFQSKDPPARTYVLDCGAGIGRVTENLLLKYFDKVDLVEQNPKFLEAAKESLQSYSSKIGEYYATGLQDFCPTPNKYDIIWCQWVLGHLQDNHLIDFFRRCSRGLRKNGILVVKENVTTSNEIETDLKDSSVTRTSAALNKIFQKAQLICLNKKKQNNFPRMLYPVYMYALKPIE